MMRRSQLALPKVSRLLVGALVLVAIGFAQDLRTVKPETIGLSSERLQRIGAAVQRSIDDKRIAGAVTLVVQREEPPYQYVVVEGTVVETTTPTPLDVREAIAIRYLGEEGGRQFVRSLEGQESVLFTVRPDRWLTADFSGDL